MTESELSERWKHLEAKVDALPEENTDACLLRELAHEYAELSKLQRQADSAKESDGFATIRIIDHEYILFRTKRKARRTILIISCLLALSVIANLILVRMT